MTCKTTLVQAVEYVRMSIGVMEIQIPTPDSVLNISVDVVDIDMP
jgi:hypothetical protein